VERRAWGAFKASAAAGVQPNRAADSEGHAPDYFMPVMMVPI
jgi:hypothetical protein